MGHQCYGFLVTLFVVVTLIQARPPVKSGAPQQPGVPQQPETNDTGDWNLGLEYNRYLQEVVQVLESDPDFRKKLETADVKKIRDGSIANELEMVNHQIRSQLDVIKRKELERLRHLAVKQFELKNGIDKKHMKIPNHIEIQNPTFEIEDLRRLIKTTTKELEENDRNRRQDFKRYEMEKKFEEEQRLEHIEDQARRAEEESRMRAMKDKHRVHGKVHQPLTKDQLEEVWESQDHMRPQDWDPKTFFAMHDLNGDNFWDEDEVRVLFKKELDKVYDPNAPEDDMREREEEMERMREHAFNEADKNKDRLISFEEFLEETKRADYEKDPGWDTLDQQQGLPFSDEEFKAFEMQRKREIQGMINKGMYPEGYPYYAGAPQGGQGHPQMGGSYGGQPHPGMPQGYQGQQMNVQPLQAEQAYRQPPPHFGGGQPQHQFEQQPQQFPRGDQQQLGNNQQQQLGAGQPKRFAGLPQQGLPQQGLPQQGLPQQGLPQQGLPQQGLPQQGLPQQDLKLQVPFKQEEVAPAQVNQLPPQPRGQPVLRAQKPSGEILQSKP